MKKLRQRAYSLLLCMIMIISALGTVSFAADGDTAVPTYPQYGVEMVPNFDMEDGNTTKYDAISLRPRVGWFHNVFMQYVDAETAGGVEWVNDEQALRFTNLGTSKEVMVMEFSKLNEAIKFGQDYKVTALLKTTNPNGDSVKIGMYDREWGSERDNTGNKTDYPYPTIEVANDEWYEFEHIFTPLETARECKSPCTCGKNEHALFFIRVPSTNGTDPNNAALEGYYKVDGKANANQAKANWSNIRDEIAKDNAKALADPNAHQTHYIYLDNFSVKRIIYLGIDNLQVHKSGNTKNDAGYVTYNYGGEEDEAATTIKWETASTADATDWNTVDSFTTTAADAQEETFMDFEDFGGKWVRVTATATDTEGRTSDPVVSQPFFVENTTDIVANGSFFQNTGDWAGDVAFNPDNNGTDGSGSLSVVGTATKTIDFNVSAETILGVTLDLKGDPGTQATVSISGSQAALLSADNDGTATFEMDGTWQTQTVTTTVASASEITITIAGNVLVDNVSIMPQLPAAQNVTISGKAVAGGTLVADYDYDGSNVGGVNEGNSIIKWYISDTDAYSGNVVKTSTKNDEGALSYTIPGNAAGKYVYAGVTPVTESNIAGTEVFSDRVKCINLSVSNLTFTNMGGYKTTGFLIPSYTYSGTKEEGNTKLEWVMADDPDAPIDMWETISVSNNYVYLTDGSISGDGYRNSPKKTVKATTIGTKGYLPLNQSTRGKYVAFKLTPVDADGNEGVPVLSHATPQPIEFVRNMINNGDFELGDVTVGNLKYGHSFNVSGVTYEWRATNSDAPGSAGGNNALAINAEAKESAYSTAAANDAAVKENTGQAFFYVYPSDHFMLGRDYTFTADVKLDYADDDVAQRVSFLEERLGGYSYAMNNATSKEWTTISIVKEKVDTVGYHSRMSFRAEGSATDTRIVKSGKWLVDNFSLYLNAPWITNLEVKGNARVGSTLTANYDFHNFNKVGVESNSPYKWLKSDYPWGPWETIEEGTTTAEGKAQLTITNDLENKYIRFSITPCEDTLGSNVLGLEMQSTAKLLVAPTDTIEGGAIVGDTTAENNNISTTVTFTNNQGITRDITTVIAIYQTTVNGDEKLTQIITDTEEIAAGATATMAPSLTVNAASVGGTAKVYVLEGSSLDKLIPLQRVENAGAAKASLDDDRAFADNDKETVKIISKTNNEDVLYSVLVKNQWNEVVYFGQGISNETDGSYQHTFSIEGAANGDEFVATITYDSGIQNTISGIKYYGSEVAVAIGSAIDAADKATIETYLEGTKIGGTHDMVVILAIDTTDYDLLTEGGQDMVIDAIIAGKNHSGNLDGIRQIVEAKAAERLADENWMNAVDASITAIEGATSDTLADVLEEYNDLYNFDLDNEYGFAINLNSENKATFMNAVKATVLAAQDLALNPNVDVKQEFVDDVAAMQDAFAYEVALQAVNVGAWEDMALILKAQNAELDVDLSSTSAYAKLSANQKNYLHQAIFADTFTSIADFQTDFPGLVSDAAKQPAGGGSGGGGGGGGGGAGGTSDGGSATGSPSPSFGGNFADTSDTNESAGGQSTASGSFKDVKTSHWAAEYIEECSKLGIINGYTDGSYGPELSITRAEYLAILLRALCISTDEEFELTFEDVPENEWFFDIVKTATAKGIVTGSSVTEFNPNNKVSREEMAVMTYRAMNAANLPLDVYNNRANKVEFSDQESISGFAADSIQKLNGLGIINGMGDGTFAPKQAVTRAMAAKIAYELLKIS